MAVDLRYATAAALSPSRARKIGVAAGYGGAGGAYALGVAQQRRKKLLQAGIQSGVIKTADLGPQDRRTIAAAAPPYLTAAGTAGQARAAGDIQSGKSPFQFIGNLGKDIAQAGMGLPGGLWTLGKAALHDVLRFSGKSELVEKVGKPTLEQYKATYGPGGGSFWENFYAHPLGPVLDVASVASLGAAGAARLGGVAVRTAEPGSALARAGQAGVRITSREGRPSLISPVVGTEGQTFDPIPREYTPRPLAKGGQILLDKLTKTGVDENWLGRLVMSREQKRLQREAGAMSQAREFGDVQAQMEGLGAITKLSPDEAQALTLAQLGVNTPRRIAAFQRMVELGTLGNEAALREMRNMGIDPRYVEHQAFLRPQVKQLILDPSDLMVQAHNAWRSRVEALRVERGIPQGEATRFERAPQRILDELEAQAVDVPQVGRIDPVTGERFTAAGVRLPDKQSAANNAPWQESDRALSSLAKNPEPGTVMWRGELRSGLPDEALGGGVGIHWTVKPDMVVNPRGPGTNIIWEAVLDDPATQAIPRGGPEWAGRHASLDSEAEIRTRPGSQLRIVGAYVYKGDKTTNDVVPQGISPFRPKSDQFPYGLDPEKWQFVPVHAKASVRHGGEIDYGPGMKAGDVKDPEHFGSLIHDTEPAIPHAAYPIQPTYVPLREATGFEPVTRRRFDPRADPEGIFARTGQAPDQYRDPHTQETIFVPRPEEFKHRNTFDTFRAGTFRTDAKAYIDHITAQSRAVEDNLFKGEMGQRAFMKDKDGNFVTVKNQDEADRLFGQGKTMAVNTGFQLQHFKSQVNHLEKVKNAVDNYLKDVPDDEAVNLLNDPQFEEFLNRVTEADAQAFVTSEWNSAKSRAHVVPRQVGEYQIKLANLDQPFKNPILRFYARMMHRWRTAVLTMMPRWWLNTAVGSTVMNTVRGVDFRDYWIASRLQKHGLIPEGVNLGHQAQIDYNESAAMGYKRGLQMTVPVKGILNAVQGIENYFRRAAMVHNLRREQRLARDAQGRVVDLGSDGHELTDIGDTLREHYDEVLGRFKGDVGAALADPKVVQRALQETNKLAYNYSILGPAERRIVRNLIPFWGWYKFISMAAYRLPVEMPARVNAMRLLSNIAAEQEAELGPIPSWVRGAIPLSLGGGKYTYLSTMGMNPFSNFMNPFGGKGVSGVLSLGQLNPLIQAGILGSGFDPLTGQQVRISPLEGVTTGPFGNVIDQQGQPVNLAQHAGFRRILAALVKSFPQYRMGGTPASGEFPESISLPPPLPPGPLSRPLPGEPKRPAIENLVGGGGPFQGSRQAQTFLDWWGAGPKQYNITKNQATAAKAAKYARKRLARDLRRTK